MTPWLKKIALLSAVLGLFVAALLAASWYRSRHTADEETSTGLSVADSSSKATPGKGLLPRLRGSVRQQLSRRTSTQLAADAATDLNVAYGSDAQQILDVYYAKDATSAPILVLTHGGGWVSGSKESMRAAATYFQSLGFVVVTPNYRLSTTSANQFPIPVNDVACAAAWIKTNATSYGGDDSTILMSGHSAGANIAALIAYNSERNWLTGCATADKPTIKGFIGLSGVYDFDLVPENRTQVQTFLGNLYGPSKWNKAEPINFASAGDPPALLVAGDQDEFANYRNTPAFGETLQDKGVTATVVVIPGYRHNDPLRHLTDNSTIQAQIAVFIKAVAGL